jgi:predicted acylesterase/phospholipase RssA
MARTDPLVWVSASPLRRLIALAGLAALVAGCGALTRHPVPVELSGSVVVRGMPDVRAWAGAPSAAMERDFAESFRKESPEDFPAGADGVVRHAHLALSGGGANGAFGAGFLNGWTQAGTRPVFKSVTGVSTGALMAPFAFLGPGYDAQLRDFYTTTRQEDVFARRSIVIGLLRRGSRDALADTTPLVERLARYVDATLLARVAQAHQRGRRLYIGTVDLDSQNFVVWNMGAIAISDHPNALALFRQVMLASASIPILFPPAYIEVEAGGQIYDEMHVDGAVAARVFLNGGVIRPERLPEHARAPMRDDVFVIHNGQLRDPPAPTPRTLGGITARVLDATGRAGMVGDLFRIYAVTRRVQGTFQWVTIAPDVDVPGATMFDPVSMTKLYDVGYRLALAGPAWVTDPPGLREELP